VSLFFFPEVKISSSVEQHHTISFCENHHRSHKNKTPIPNPFSDTTLTLSKTIPSQHC